MGVECESTSHLKVFVPSEDSSNLAHIALCLSLLLGTWED